MNQLTVPVVRDFRNSWKLSPRTAGKHLERLKRFFNFCVENNWLKTSPATALRVGKITESEVVPFTEEEVEEILQACDERKTDKDALTQASRLRLLAEFMIATGLRIGDAVMVSTDKIVKDSVGYSLTLRTAKTGSDVVCPIPTPLAKSILALGPRPFTTGNSTPDACASNWRKVFSDAFERAKVEGHPHQFRHVFAKRLLVSSVPVGLVSILLGHSKVSTTERHYSKWVRERQTVLSDAVRKSWKNTEKAQKA